MFRWKDNVFQNTSPESRPKRTQKRVARRTQISLPRASMPLVAIEGQIEEQKAWSEARTPAYPAIVTHPWILVLNQRELRCLNWPCIQHNRQKDMHEAYWPISIWKKITCYCYNNWVPSLGTRQACQIVLDRYLASGIPIKRVFRGEEISISFLFEYYFIFDR